MERIEEGEMKHFNWDCNCASCMNMRAEMYESLKELRDRASRDAETYAPEGNEPIWAFISDATDALSKAEGKHD